MVSLVEVVNEQQSVVEVVQEGNTTVVEVIGEGVSVIEVINDGVGVNPTNDFIPIRNGLSFGDSPIRYDIPLNLLISTAELQVPSGTVFIGEDAALRNHGGFLSSNNLQRIDTKIIIGRSYGGSTTQSILNLDGSEDRVSIARFGPEQQDFPAQIIDTETKTIGLTDPLEEISVIFTEILPAIIISHHLRGVSGKATMRLDTAKDPDDNNLSDEDFLALPDSALLTIANGFNNGFVGVWDFDDPKKRDGSVDGLGTEYNTYTVPVDFDIGRKIKLTWISADGNPVTFKGSTVNGRFFPYTDTDFQLRTDEFMTIVDDTLITINNHWTSLKVNNLTGWADYIDLDTTANPIVVTPNVFINLTNDKAGSGTLITSLPTDVTQLWDEENNFIDLSDLKVGDQLVVRVEYTITPDANNRRLDNQIFVQGKDDLDVNTFNFTLAQTPLIMDLGGGTAFRHICLYRFYIGSDDVQRGELSLQVKCSGNADIVVNGFYIEVVR